MESKSQENKFYNYVYLDPRKRGNFCYEELNVCFLYEPYYIGKGSKSNGTMSRKYQHLHKSNLTNKTAKTHKIKKLYKKHSKEELKSFVLQINSDISEENAFIIERKLISIIGRCDKGKGTLCNHTDGGEGPSGNTSYAKGKKYEDFMCLDRVIVRKEKMSIASRGQNNPASKSRMSDEDRKLKGLKSITTRINNGQIRKGVDCNFSKEYIGEDAIKIKTQKSANTYKQKIKDGYIPKCRSKLPIYRATTPNGEEILFQGKSLFAVEYNISLSLINKFINKGKVCLDPYNKTKKLNDHYYNTLGWEFKSIN